MIPPMKYVGTVDGAALTRADGQRWPSVGNRKQSLLEVTHRRDMFARESGSQCRGLQPSSLAVMLDQLLMRLVAIAPWPLQTCSALVEQPPSALAILGVRRGMSVACSRGSADWSMPLRLPRGFGHLVKTWPCLIPQSRRVRPW